MFAAFTQYGLLLNNLTHLVEVRKGKRLQGDMKHLLADNALTLTAWVITNLFPRAFCCIIGSPVLDTRHLVCSLSHWPEYTCTILLQLSDKIVSDSDGASLSIHVPRKGIWGTAAVVPGNSTV